MVTSSMVIVATSISSEIPIQKLISQFSRDFYFQSVRVTAMQILSCYCIRKDYLHVVMTIKEPNLLIKVLRRPLAHYYYNTLSDSKLSVLFLFPN